MKTNAFFAAVGSLVLFAACSSTPTSNGANDPTASTSAADTACTSSKECSGPLPQICETCPDGKTECAHWDCEEHECKIAICDEPPDACRVAADCKGPLPQLCQECADGKTECAHWDCERHECKIEICQDHGGPAN